MTTTKNESTTAPTAADLAELVQRGSAALGDGDLRTALETFEQVIGAFPDRPEGHNNLGALYTSLGDFAKAEVCFDRVLEILPCTTAAWSARGRKSSIRPAPISRPP